MKLRPDGEDDPVSGFRPRQLSKPRPEKEHSIQNNKSRASSQAPKTHSSNKDSIVYKRRLIDYTYLYTTTTTKLMHIELKPNQTTQKKTNPKARE